MSKRSKALRASDARKIALEKELVKRGKIFPRTHYAPRTFLGRILAVTLAFLLGILAAVGGIFGAGYYFGSRPLKDALGMFGLDYSAWLTDTAADLTVLELVQQVSGGGIDTLGDIARYTPYVDTLIAQLNEQTAALGMTLDGETLKATPFQEMGSYFSSAIQTAELGKALGVTAQSDALMIALCYGAEGTNEEGGDHTVQDGVIVMNEGKSPTTIADLNEGAGDIVGKVTVEAALGVNGASNSAMRYLAYGTEDINYTREGETVTMLTDPMTGKLYQKKRLADLSGTDNVMANASIRDVITIGDATSGLLAAISDWTVNDLGSQARLERLKLSQVMTIGADASGIMQAMRDWRIGDLTDQNKINSLTLGSVLTLDENAAPILQALRNTRLGELSQATQELRLSDILDKDAFANNALLESIADSSLDTLAHDIRSLTVADIYGGEIYSYLDLGENGKNPTYLSFLQNYRENAEDAAQRKPLSPITAADLRVTESYYYEGVQVQPGWFLLDNGQTTGSPLEESAVHKTMDGNAVKYYTRTEVFLTPQYAWKFINYASGGALQDITLRTLDEGDATIEENGTPGTEVRDETTNKPLYFVTQRPTAPADDASAPVTETVAYPVWQDGNGYFYRERVLEENGERSVVRRVDLERAVVGYIESDDSTQLPPDENGNVTYEEQSYPVRTKTENGAETFYISVRRDVVQRYYSENGTGLDILDETAAVTTRFQGTWTEGGVTVERSVDRFLHGTWYLIFGGEKLDDTGKITAVVDNTDLPILEIADKIAATSGLINSTPLWKLYLHGMIAEDPYQLLPGSGFTDGGKTYTNLNQLDVGGVIRYIKQLPTT